MKQRVALHFTSMLHTHIVNMANSLLTIHQWKYMSDQLQRECDCNISIIGERNNDAEVISVTYEEMRNIFFKCESKHQLMSDWIRDSNVWLNSSNLNGYEAVHHAVSMGNDQWVRSLLIADPRNISSVVTGGGFTTLHLTAISNLNIESIMRLLLASGMNVSALDAHSRTANDIYERKHGLHLAGIPLPLGHSVIVHNVILDTFKDEQHADINAIYGVNQHISGGWSTKTFINSKKSETCDFDIRINLSLEDFIR